jgi:hypothetical protein
VHQGASDSNVEGLRDDGGAAERTLGAGYDTRGNDGETPRGKVVEALASLDGGDVEGAKRELAALLAMF